MLHSFIYCFVYGKFSFLWSCSPASDSSHVSRIRLYRLLSICLCICMPLISSHLTSPGEFFFHFLPFTSVSFFHMPIFRLIPGMDLHVHVCSALHSLLYLVCYEPDATSTLISQHPTFIYRLSSTTVYSFMLCV